MNDPKDLKVLVKKADGTFVHVPLSQLKKDDKKEVAGKNVEKTEVQPPVAPPVNLPVDESKDGIVKPTVQSVKPKEVLVQDKKAEMPVKTNIKFGHTKLTEPSASKELSPKVNADKGDYSSLLEEELPVVSKIVPLSSPGREKQIDTIISGLSFKAPSGNNSRLRTVIQLFLKDVRGESETVDILRRREIDGGLGLSEEQAKEVVEKCKKTAVPVENVPVPVLKERKISVEPVEQKQPNEIKQSVVGLNEKENNRLEKELPMVQSKESSVASDVKPVVKKTTVSVAAVPKQVQAQPPAAPVANTKKILDDQVTRATMAEVPVEPFRINPEQLKPTMHDVRPGSIAVGPVDEIRNFNLVDFRRLSTDPVEAANRLKQKFLNLREESIMLYFEGLEAWKNSPLFHDYIKAVSESIAKHMPLAKVVAAERTRIQMPEISALVRMEKQLG